MTHPRLSVSQMCTYSWSFGQNLELIDALGLAKVGLLINKADDYGRDAAVAALADRGIPATTVITRGFDLSAPDTWDAVRAELNGVTDLAARTGGSPYFTPGAADGRSFDELTEALAEAVAPCIGYAESRGVRLAIEPTLRPDRSYFHTLAEGIEVADRTGLGLIADIGNCWGETDYEATVRRAGSRIAVVQICDVRTDPPPPPGDRVVPGDGDLDIAGFVRAALDSGYTGVFELEVLGPGVEAEGYAATTRRAVDRATALLEEVL
ncbi:sugar phosphate isomerase/epimerase [Nocardia sp. BMG111209]|uniref:sugar phosphate isomerase/epimerase family protein n=1 Tax=Nocardia sp. BMG111209 TaxID=1160137 RepID=UPI0003A4030C|nr:sugar phosphate isomerase/epimerase family protein [Nocardia sp. BMG111209]